MLLDKVSCAACARDERAHVDANDYSTSLTGVKYKLAHKRADQGKWSASTRAQRKRLIKILEEMIRDLQEQGAEEERQPIQISEARPKKRNGRAKMRAG